MSKKNEEPKEVVVAMRHHGDPVQHDIANQGNHAVLLHKRNTPLTETKMQPEEGDPYLPDYQHGDPQDGYKFPNLNAKD